MRQSSIITTRSYRIYLRDSENRLTAGVDVDFASDDEAREHAAQMLDMQAAHRCAEIWDRTRLVCAVHKEGTSPDYRGSLNPPAARPTSPSEPVAVTLNLTHYPEFL